MMRSVCADEDWDGGGFLPSLYLFNPSGNGVGCSFVLGNPEGYRSWTQYDYEDTDQEF